MLFRASVYILHHRNIRSRTKPDYLDRLARNGEWGYDADSQCLVRNEMARIPEFTPWSNKEPMFSKTPVYLQALADVQWTCSLWTVLGRNETMADIALNAILLKARSFDTDVHVSWKGKNVA